ncbi:outer membrane transport energization protein ExbD [Sphingobacterium alimentarium]|uniref:Outer membrane transport energization protein ExbD n=1 Tax=Sphingobacterium alimentarium TaxID=797292 RepID=A0A4R3VV88_9SPHI|nr:biopolymer transporter ExbD [Sphingobacterium alimentarium]TCV18915.1 outer membrane transport energization protein ExbD [Sphingobacterium alimentarium]
MAELNQDSGKGGKGGKVRSKKNGGKVDLTAMVDLAFLLITFFMLTTSLNKPQAMDVAMPDKNVEQDKNTDVDVDEHRSVTLVLGSDDKLVWYQGDVKNPLQGPTVIDYSNEGLRSVLLKMQKLVPQQAGGKDVIVVIRPSEKSVTRNIIDALDEMKIVDIKRYMISNRIMDDEIELLKKENLYND